jgi:hypothetical protein
MVLMDTTPFSRVARAEQAFPVPKGRGRQWSSDKAAAMMKEWPESWEGEPADVPVGRALVAIMHAFMTYLQQQELSSTTLRRHLDNLWLIGGEIIREINYHPRRRAKPARSLLFEAIQYGEAPSVGNLTVAEQTAVDATARKLLKFLSTSNSPTE